jgi:hypothetical protein
MDYYDKFLKGVEKEFQSDERLVWSELRKNDLLCVNTMSGAMIVGVDHYDRV